MTQVKTQEKHYTDYATAINWLHGNLILCNNITNIDDSIFLNARFDVYDDESDYYAFDDIYQMFLTDFSTDDVEWLENTFSDMLFTYSDLLDCYVLCVNHFGTMWNGVKVEVLSNDWWNVNGKEHGYRGF